MVALGRPGGDSHKMTNTLQIAAGQYSDQGRKESNQDFHGLYVPVEPQLSAKGIAVALADGISSSDVSQEAAQAAVTAFLEDYYCTSDAWSVKTIQLQLGRKRCALCGDSAWYDRSAFIRSCKWSM